MNVHHAREIGTTEMVAFEGSWPQGCHEAIKKMVVTMNGSRKHVKVEELEIYNTETIFARVMVFMKFSVTYSHQSQHSYSRRMVK